MTLYLEDLAVGQRYVSPSLVLASDIADRFGADLPPASEMHVASLTMRLLVDSEFRPAGGMLGAGIEGLRWPVAAQQGETLRVESEILEVRRSKSRPDRGLAKIRTTTLNAANQPVQVMTSTVIIRARTSGSPDS
jgi:acyl dehydratase